MVSGLWIISERASKYTAGGTRETPKGETQTRKKQAFFYGLLSTIFGHVVSIEGFLPECVNVKELSPKPQYLYMFQN